ncbi:alpha-glucan family phosphorylase [Candidatus Peregrinibacteria bacterium]|nr:alpha-glucan family phosphorylase [Candidatus Peregrinibacteria bacterium]
MKVAYFSMEFALLPEIPNFAGGLGVLATDMMRSCADMGIPAVGMSIIYHQSDSPDHAFDISKYFEKVKETVGITIEDRKVKVGAWKYEIKGLKGNVPVYFLTTNFPENERWDRDITKNLYPGHAYTRLAQEAVLGYAGLRMLRALGYNDIDYYHMNEGHSAFLTLERYKETDFIDSEVKKSCRFTTHTPIAAGHDHFEYSLANQILSDKLPWHTKKLGGEKNLNMTKLALNMSGKANGVSQKHMEVCKKMFPEHEFIGITNGVHHRTWVQGEMIKLFDKNLKGWKEDPYQFAKAMDLPEKEVKKAHNANKQVLIDYINKNTAYFPYPKNSLHEDDYFDKDTLTVTFSRRFVPYKRPLLLFRDLIRLREIGYKKLQIIYSGHCSPNDEFCNNIMNDLRKLEKELRGQVRLAVMPDRNLDTAAMLIAGSDVWLNNPEPPYEASGTSGMKAAMNGGINLSIADGWWIEAAEKEPESGWTFGTDESGHDEIDADELYKKLGEIIDIYYNNPTEWVHHMKKAITLGAYFNTHRCVSEYLDKMWN